MYQVSIRNNKNHSIINTPSIDIIREIVRCFEITYGTIEFIKILILE